MKKLLVIVILLISSVSHAEYWWEYVADPWLSRYIYWDYSEDYIC